MQEQVVGACTASSAEQGKIWPTGRVMASLEYASSRQSEGPPISYPPTTNDVAAGTAITSQPVSHPPLRTVRWPGRGPCAPVV